MTNRSRLLGIPTPLWLSCVHIPLIVIVSGFLASCDMRDDSSNRVVGDYDRLCGIYAEYLSSELTAGERGVIMSSRVREELPDIYEDYKRIMNVSPVERYQLLRQIVKAKSGKQWRCEAYEKLYFNDDG